MRATIKLLLCIIFCLIFCSCAGEVLQTYDISQYMEHFVSLDYSAMYAEVATIADIDEETFVQKYDAIFTGLGVTEIVLENLSEPDEDGVYTYTATYKTQNYGDFTNEFTLKTAFENKRCVVVWDYSLIFPEMAQGDKVRVKTLDASRGEIFAADGSVLAKNAYADTVYMNTDKVENISDVSGAISSVTGLTNTEIINMFNDALADGTDIVTLGTFYSDELTEEQKQKILSVPGLGIDDEMYTLVRDYALGETAAHIIGYTGYGEEESLPEGYSVSDKMGLTGLEAAYENTLRGKDGKIIYIEDRWGENISTLYLTPSEEGEDLKLTIEPALQQQAYYALCTYLQKGETGVAIVMDASTGYVEAMASYPSYDNNLFTFPLSEETLEYLNASENDEPLFSRATQGLYPPGSVFKPFTASVALQVGSITPETEFEGEIIENQWIPDEEGWVYPAITRVDDSGTPIKLYNAMVSSDNIYFAFVALRIGDETFLEHLERMGMEDAVPFDMPVKKANSINTTSSMTRKLLADMGYGQGELLITPIQLSAMYSAFANKTGDMQEPILVQKICQTDGLDYNTISEKQPTVWVKDAISSNNIEILTPILEAVINEGTGRPVRISGMDIAGKTGTAEIGDNKSREISWFAGYWLDGDYDRLVVVMVDVAAEEGKVKFDIANALLAP